MNIPKKIYISSRQLYTFTKKGAISLKISSYLSSIISYFLADIKFFCTQLKSHFPLIPALSIQKHFPPTNNFSLVLNIFQTFYVISNVYVSSNYQPPAHLRNLVKQPSNNHLISNMIILKCSKLVGQNIQTYESLQGSNKENKKILQEAHRP